MLYITNTRCYHKMQFLEAGSWSVRRGKWINRAKKAWVLVWYDVFGSSSYCACYEAHKFRNHSENEINEIHFWELRDWKANVPNLFPGLAGCRQLYRVCLPYRQPYFFFSLKEDKHHSYSALVISSTDPGSAGWFLHSELMSGRNSAETTVFNLLMAWGWTGTMTPMFALKPSWGTFFLFWTDLLWLCLGTSQFEKESSMWQDSRKIFWVQSHL